MSLCSLGLSCEPVKEEPDQFCEHGRVSITCEWCAMNELHNQFIELRNRIEALHEHKLRQIDENRKISRRVDDIEKWLTNVESKFADISTMNNNIGNSPQICPVVDLT